MAVTKIEVMDGTKLLGIAVLAIGLQMAFFLIPFYFTPNSIDTIYLNADKYPNDTDYKFDRNICVRNWRLAKNVSLYSSTNEEQLFHRFVFRLPRIHNGSSPVDHSKWHSMAFGLLTVSTNDTIDNSLSTTWNATLFICSDYRKKLYQYGSSSFGVKLDESSHYSTSKPTTSKYSTTLTLVEFEPIFYDEYILVIQSESVDLQDFSLLQMSLTLTKPNAAFSGFMVYLKTIFFALALLFIIWCELKFYKNTGVVNSRQRATFGLGLALLCLDVPVEWFTLLDPLNFLPYIKNLRTDIYYAALATCSLIFVLRYQTTWNKSKAVEEPPSLSIGVFAMWNIYTLMMMYLYAPEHDEESTPTARITTPTFPVSELMAPPSYDEYLKSINAENAAGGSEIK